MVASTKRAIVITKINRYATLNFFSVKAPTDATD